jgi:hypothetical protein
MPARKIWTTELRKYPIDNCICIIDYLNRLTNVVYFLLNNGNYVDGEYSDYVGDD